MGMNPHAITKEFEKELCAYTGAPYAVAVNSCTMALLLAVRWQFILQHRNTMMHWMTPNFEIEIPRRTYVSVPQSIIHAGGRPTFREEEWLGAYQLKPLPVWDSARWLTGGHYRMICERLASATGQFVCLSFHASKTCGDTQGGAILHDNAEADAWLRRARFDGRTEGVAPKDDKFEQVGWHCYLSPDVAARLLWKLSVLPKHNEPLPNDEYVDLSTLEIFK